MNSGRKGNRFVIRCILILIEIVICFLLQTAVFPALAFAGIVPDLLMTVVAANAYTRGRITGMLTGLACGLLVDCCYGSIIGLYGLLYMVTGYLCGCVVRFYASDDYTIPILLTAAGEFFYCVLYYAAEYLLRGQLQFGAYFMQIILPRILYTVVAAVPVYRGINSLHLRLWSREHKEE